MPRDYSPGAALSSSPGTPKTTSAAVDQQLNPNTLPPSSLVASDSGSLGYRVITLNVGGSIFSVSHSTLMTEQSLLATDAAERFAHCIKDKDGYPFYDRDPTNFRHILNYLRGYPLALSPEDATLLTEDAEFFRLPGLLRELGGNPGEIDWRFQPGPGVSPNGDTFSSAELLSYIGPGPLTPGVPITIYFRVERCLVASIGILSPGQRLDRDFRHRGNYISYSSTGEINCNVLPIEKIPDDDKENHSRYSAPPRISLDVPETSILLGTCDPTSANTIRFAENDDLCLRAHLSSDSTSLVVEFSKNGSVVHAVGLLAEKLTPHATSDLSHGPTNVELPPLQPAVHLCRQSIIWTSPMPFAPRSTIPPASSNTSRSTNNQQQQQPTNGPAPTNTNNASPSGPSLQSRNAPPVIERMLSGQLNFVNASEIERNSNNNGNTGNNNNNGRDPPPSVTISNNTQPNTNSDGSSSNAPTSG